MQNNQLLEVDTATPLGKGTYLQSYLPTLS